MRIIFINGAPRSGKDSAGKYLKKNIPGTDNYIMKFATEVKDRVHRAFYLDVGPEFYDSCKDEPNGDFDWATPRNVYKQFSEEFMKPIFGVGIFGRLLLARLRVNEREVGQKAAIITDSGFRAEAVPIVEHYGPESCTLLRMHRPGYGFEHDSRELIDLHDLGVPCYDIPSPSGNLDAMYKELRGRVPFLFREHEE
jgi:hypothetical protein